MLISILIPTLNAASDLEKSIKSALAQTGVEFEVLVLDGASTDGTRKLLESYGDRVRWISEPDKGVYNAMNKGIALAKGRYIYFLGAGDILRPNVLSEVAPYIEELSSPSFIYGDVWFADKAERHGGVFDAQRLSGLNICHQSIFYGRDLFKKLGTYDERYKVLADYAFNILCWSDKSVVKKYIPIVIADYQGNGMSERVHDAKFKRDRSHLVWRHLETRPYWMRYLQVATPTPLRKARVSLLKQLRRVK